MRPKKHYLEIYDITYLFCLNWKRADFKKWYHRKHGRDPEIKGGTAWTFCVDDNHTIIIWTESNSVRNLVHECVHAANYSLETRGVTADFNNDEPQAYLVEWIFSAATGEV